jgi:DNA-directed RNA polymerase specialized sigma24 family protein
VISEAALLDSLAEFVKAAEPRLRHALCAAFGQQDGREAAAHALAYACENWERVEAMENPVGYLWGVGRNHARRQRFRSRAVALPARPFDRLPWVEPKLPKALSRLSERQRVTVMLVCGLEWTHAEVADLLGVSRSTVQTQLERGLATLRNTLGATP